MSDLAAVIMAWCAVHLIVALHNLYIHLRRQTDLEYLAFATLSFAFSVYTFGAARLTDATSYAEGSVAMRIAYVGAPIALGAFVAFIALLDDRQGPRVVRLAIGWSALGLFANLAGLFFDPDVPAQSSPYREPEQTIVALIWTVGACGLMAWTLYRAFHRAGSDRDLALLGGGALLLVAAAIHDQAVHFFGAFGPYLLEHAAIGVSFAFSYMLLRRLAGTESELERRTAEVEASYQDLRRARDDLIQQEQLAAVGELSAVIAHEIRNPLAILRNAAAGLRREGLDPTDHETLLVILDEESDRLGRLSNDLATYAQPLTPKLEPIIVRELLDECQAAVLSGAPERLEVDADIGGGPEQIEGDVTLLRLALSNVIDNAVQAMPAGGRLTIGTRAAAFRAKDAVEIEVGDSGEGMDTLVRDKALDPFFTTRASGTGLGLAIVERIVRAHGGSVQIDSGYGRGTRVTITVPVGP